MNVEARTNRLLQQMSAKDYRRVRPYLVHVEMNLAEVLVNDDVSSKHVFFPVSGLIAVHTPTATSVSVHFVGQDGMVGASAAAGIPMAPATITVQGDGATMRMEARHLRFLASGSASLQRQMHRYTCRLLEYTSETVTFNGFHGLEARLARCLLDASTKAHSDELRLTQELIATVVGARRSGVSVAASALRRRKVIRYARGRLTIVNSAELRRLAYDSARREP